MEWEWVVGDDWEELLRQSRIDYLSSGGRKKRREQKLAGTRGEEERRGSGGGGGKRRMGRVYPGGRGEQGGEGEGVSRGAGGTPRDGGGTPLDDGSLSTISHRIEGKGRRRWFRLVRSDSLSRVGWQWRVLARTAVPGKWERRKRQRKVEGVEN